MCVGEGAIGKMYFEVAIKLQHSECLCLLYPYTYYFWRTKEYYIHYSITKVFSQIYQPKHVLRVCKCQHCRSCKCMVKSASCSITGICRQTKAMDHSLLTTFQ
jgi:hypothetical protein